LQSPFSEKELRLTIKGMKSESAPGPNGFTITFFKKLWQLIKNEILGMVQDFDNNKLDLRRLNYGVITLVPKVKDANCIKQYMSICLLIVDFKIFSKMLTDRITPIADGLISESQTAFIKGRNIMEGVVILHEVVHELRRTGRRWVLFKIDFKKVYDKVKWEFIKEVMAKEVLPDSWIQQAMSTIQGEGGGGCINVNRYRTKFFNTYKWLR
jgi:hypothetical protein